MPAEGAPTEANRTSPPISATQTFACSTEELWGLISEPGNLNHAHPYCETNDVLIWTEEERVDRLEYLNGRTYVRRFQTWVPGEGYTLFIGEVGGPQSYVTWAIETFERNGSRLTITVHPHLLASLPTLISFLPHRLWVRPRLRRYLRSVVGGFAHVASTGEPVPRNLFGRHPWFS